MYIGDQRERRRAEPELIKPGLRFKHQWIPTSVALAAKLLNVSFAPPDKTKTRPSVLTLRSEFTLQLSVANLSCPSSSSGLSKLAEDILSRKVHQFHRPVNPRTKSNRRVFRTEELVTNSSNPCPL